MYNALRIIHQPIIHQMFDLICNLCIYSINLYPQPKQKSNIYTLKRYISSYATFCVTVYNCVSYKDKRTSAVVDLNENSTKIRCLLTDVNQCARIKPNTVRIALYGVLWATQWYKALQSDKNTMRHPQKKEVH